MKEKRTAAQRSLMWCAAGSVLFVLLGTVGEARSAVKSQEQKKPVRIAFLAATTNGFGEAIYRGIASQAKRSNATFDVFSANFNPQTQFNQVQDLITSGKYDAFIVYSVDGVSISPAVVDALDEGIKVVAAATPIGPNYRTAEPQIASMTGSVVQPSIPNANHIARTISSACRGINPCEVGYLAGSRTLGSDVQRQKSVQSFLKRYKNVRLVSLIVTGYDRAGGLKGTQDLLLAHPGVDVIAGSGDQQILGAAQALSEAGIPTGKVKLIGDFASVAGVKAIRNGTMHASIAGLPKTNGKLATEIAIRAVRGVPITDRGIDITDKSPVGPVITRANAARFKAQWIG